MTPARPHIVVDGYNFIMASDSLRPLCLRNKEEARAECGERLSDYARVTCARITIVYDNRSGRAGNRRQVGEIEEIYCRPDETADDVIKTMAARGGKRLTVVTSDREVAGYCRHHGAEILGARTFEEALDTAREMHR